MASCRFPCSFWYARNGTCRRRDSQSYARNSTRFRSLVLKAYLDPLAVAVVVAVATMSFVVSVTMLLSSLSPLFYSLMIILLVCARIFYQLSFGLDFYISLNDIYVNYRLLIDYNLFPLLIMLFITNVFGLSGYLISNRWPSNGLPLS